MSAPGDEPDAWTSALGAMSRRTEPVLVLGATGTTGRQIMVELDGRGVPARGVARSTTPRFDWNDPTTWEAVLSGIRAVYLLPPVGIPDPSVPLLAFIDRALAHGVERYVLLSASAIPTGSPGVGAVAARLPDLVPEWAVLRPSWFMQNFVNQGHYMAQDLARNGSMTTSTGEGRVAFVDARDIAAVAAWALSAPESPQAELIITGPEALTYDEVAALITAASSREIHHVRATPAQVTERMIAAGIPPDFAPVLAGLENDIRGGSEDRVSDAVQRATGRAPRSFAIFAREYADHWR